MHSTTLRPPPRAPSVGGLTNLLKTGLLFFGLTALALFVGQRLGGLSGLMLAGSLVVVMNAVSYWFSDRIALAMHRAEPVEPHQLPWLHAMVAGLARRANVPMPRLFVIPSRTPNAFATGRSPEHAAIAVTHGLLERMDRRELEGVLAHELGHVLNRDTLIMTVAGTIAGVITHAAQLVFFWGGSLLGRGDDDDDGGLGHGLASLGVLLVAPIAATVLQLALSRTREFEADATAARLTGDPHGLASALARLEADNHALPYDRSPATAHLFIVNPLHAGVIASLFSTHPPVAERIARLVG